MKSQSKLNTEYRRHFYNLYHSKIIPIFARFEQERKNELTSLISFMVVIAGFVATAICGWFTPPPADNIVGVLMVISIPFIIVGGIILLCWLPWHYNGKFTKKLKCDCMPKIVSVFENMRWYDCFEMISDIELEDSQLFGVYNRRFSYDAFEGVYKDVPFKIAETYTYYESGSGKNKSITNLFKGVVIKFRANKIIRNTTIVATKHDNNIRNNYSVTCITIIALFKCVASDISQVLVGELSIWSTIFKMLFVVVIYLIVILSLKGISVGKTEVLHEMKLEDPEFNKKYKAYSSDQIEGRYLITPAFIERFNNLQTAFGTNKAKCSFYGDEIMFAISTNKNLFEVGDLFHSLNNPKQLETFFNELSSILALIEYFKLDERTGL